MSSKFMNEGNDPDPSGRMSMGSESGRLRNSEYAQEDRISIGTGEQRAVCCMRSFLILVVVLAAALVSTAVYFSTDGTETDDFESQFLDHANKVTDAFRVNAARRLAAVEAFAISITTSAQESGQTWPNVTVADFERRATFTLELAAVVSLTMIVVVQEEDRAGWEAYSNATQGWIQESLDYQTPRLPADFDYKQDQIYLDALEGGPLGTNNKSTIRPYIQEFGPAQGAPMPNNTGPYAPWWQWAPFFYSMTVPNYNTLTHPLRKQHVNILLDTKAPMVTRANDFKEIKEVGKTAFLNLALARRSGFMASLSYEAGPVSDLYFPVFAHHDDDPAGSNTLERQLGAVLTSYVWWQVYFTNVLPENAQGVVVVLENSCDQQFTYIIHGEHANYLGAGDLHNPKYDHMEVSTGFGAFLGGSGRIEDQLPGQCIYNVRVYPSEELEATFRSNNPLYFTLIVVGVFLFTSFVFIMYDMFVEKRQKVVMEQAVQSTEVVQSLFPANVRDRLFNDDNKNNTLRGSNNNNGTNPEEQALSGEMVGVNDAMAIADLHENCTVLFADLAGFTSWSDKRQPRDVFALLEAIYGAFDAIAKKRGVFKVETIGDCYLAITGVPRPQKHHARIMCKFAAESMQAMNQLIHSKLVNTLGEDTANLQMRVGVHSGAVTAGVLRGDRARFQLFGDTVNTAARMESNGLPGKIQASAATAECLRKSGKGAWLSEREGGVEAKGKGIMQTFWVQPVLDGDGTTSVGTFRSRDSTNVAPDLEPQFQRVEEC